MNIFYKQIIMSNQAFDLVLGRTVDTASVSLMAARSTYLNSLINRYTLKFIRNSLTYIFHRDIYVESVLVILGNWKHLSIGRHDTTPFTWFSHWNLLWIFVLFLVEKTVLSQFFDGLVLICIWPINMSAQFMENTNI